MQFLKTGTSSFLTKDKHAYMSESQEKVMNFGDI